MREKSKFALSIKADSTVQSPHEKYLSSNFQKTMHPPRHPASMKRDVTADRHRT
jgi:hypothetical protein